MKLTYSLFEGYSLSKVRRVVELEGKKARDMHAIFKRGLRREPRVGDVYAGGRIDAIEDDAIRDNGDGTATAFDVYRARRATLPVDKATRLLTAFESAFPRAGYIDSVRHLIEESRA